MLNCMPETLSKSVASEVFVRLITNRIMNNLQCYQRLALFAVVFSLPALPAKIGTAGIPNFHQVNDHIFRGGQPAPEGWRELAGMGVKTVIDLRRADEHSTVEEAQAVAAAGMTYVNVPMNGVVAPTDAQMAKVLRLLESGDPVFVHCRRGADRTGAVIACYRIAHDGWGRDRALKEAKSLGMSWTQLGLKRYIKEFQPATSRVASGSQTPLEAAQP